MRPRLERVLVAQCVAPRTEAPYVCELDGPFASQDLRAAAGIVSGDTSGRIGRVAAIEDSVGGRREIDVVPHRSMKIMRARRRPTSRLRQYANRRAACAARPMARSRRAIRSLGRATTLDLRRKGPSADPDAPRP